MIISYDHLQLEKTSPSLFDMLNIPAKECHDPFASLKQAGFPYTVFDDVLPSSTGDDIFVRGGVLLKLQAAQKMLASFSGYEDCKLEVTYGYRSPDIQHQKYVEQLARFYAEGQDAQSIMEQANNFIACPHTAGHTCGAAVDIWITDQSGNPLDFGSPMHDLSDQSSIHNRDIPKPAYANRMALRACMMAADFAPYNGEWWHFSNGDREHAIWCEGKEAFYTPHSFNAAEHSFAAWTEAKFNYIDFIKEMEE